MGPDEIHFALRLVLSLTASVVFIIFGLANSQFFRHPSFPTRPTSRRWMVHQATSFLLAIAEIGTLASGGPYSPGRSLVTVLLFGGALGLFAWAQETVKRSPPHLAFAGVTPDQFWGSGPYGLVRHPFYLAFTLAWLGGVVGTGNPWLLAGTLWMMTQYARAAFEEEAEYLRSPYADQYRRYQKRVGMFLPRPRWTADGTSLLPASAGQIAVALIVTTALALAVYLVLEAITVR